MLEWAWVRRLLKQGTSGSVPLNALSWVELTNLSFTISYPTDCLANFSLSGTSSKLLGHQLSVVAPGLLTVNLRFAATNILGPLTNIANLSFVAPPSAPSTFARLEVAGVTGRRPDGTVASSDPQDAGRVVIVNEEPLVELVTGADGVRWLSLYSRTGSRTQVLSCTNAFALDPWEPKYFDATVTALLHSIGPIQSTNAVELFRAKRVVGP